MKRFLLVIVMAALAAPMAFGGDAKKSADMRFLVVRETNGKPVRNAAVILHPVGSDGKQKSGGLELKTDPEGRAKFDGIPYGKLRVQVIAPGFRTFGEDFEIAQPTHEITIKLQRPKEQYSIYK